MINTPIPIRQYETASDLLDAIGNENLTPEIQTAIFKAWDKIHGVGEFCPYETVMVAVSGGSDSDIIVDLIERVGHPHCTVRYVFYDTGVEFQATKRHLEDLEQQYGITIERHRASVPVPIGVQKNGLPFISKRISDYIHRLQKYDFQWEDEPFDVLYVRYPRCKAALRWWCNDWGEKSQMNINHHKWLKEFMIENPPDFMISDACCSGAKKQTAHRVEKELSPDLNVQGIRKAEGGYARRPILPALTMCRPGAVFTVRCFGLLKPTKRPTSAHSVSFIRTAIPNTVYPDGLRLLSIWTQFRNRTGGSSNL